MTRTLLPRLAAVLGLSLGLGATPALAHPGVQVSASFVAPRPPPPPVQVHVRPAAPAPAAVWVPGTWTWTLAGWSWVPGYWTTQVTYAPAQVAWSAPRVPVAYVHPTVHVTSAPRVLPAPRTTVTHVSTGRPVHAASHVSPSRPSGPRR